VNSPGGSYIASDAIWREVRQAKQAGKPVVVSMGALAASGGYFVSCAADSIVALPGTLTGSIGVLAGKLVAGRLLDRVGLTHDAVQAGRHARLLSARVPFTDEEWSLLDEWLDRVYDDFLGRVAAGRGLSRERVHEIARGRVWTGADAAEIGLVDTLGGLETAARLARTRAGLPADAELVSYPKVPLVRRIQPPRSSEDPAAAAATMWPAPRLADLQSAIVGPLLAPSLVLH
jgi:protease-4